MIVSKESGIAGMTVESGPNHIKCFAGACKMNFELAGTVSQLQDLVHEAFPLAANHHILIRFEEAVRVQLDKQPVGPAGNRYASAPPTTPPPQRKRIIFGQSAIVQSRNRKAAHASGPIKDQRTRKDNGKRGFISNFQAWPGMMGSAFVQWPATLINRIEARDL